MWDLLKELKSAGLNNKSALTLIIVGVLLLSIPVTYYLSQKPQTIKSRAQECQQICTAENICDEERICDQETECDSETVCDNQRICDYRNVCDTDTICDYDGNCYSVDVNCRDEEYNCRYEQVNCREEQINCREVEVNCRNEQVNCREEDRCEEVCTQPPLAEGIEEQTDDEGTIIDDIIGGIIDFFPGDDEIDEEIPTPTPEPEIICEEDEWEFAGCNYSSCGGEYWRCPKTGQIRGEGTPDGGDCVNSDLNPACEEQEAVVGVPPIEEEQTIVEEPLEEDQIDSESEEVPTIQEENQTEIQQTEQVQLPIEPQVTAVLRKTREAEYETVTESYTCQAALSCHSIDGINTGKATKRWTNINSNYLGSNVGCPGEEVVDASSECPPGNAYSGIRYIGDETFTSTRTHQKVPALYSKVNECERVEKHDPLDCSNGERCYRDFFADTSTGCEWVESGSHCVKADICDGEGLGWIGAKDQCRYAQYSDQYHCSGGIRCWDDYYRDVGTACTWQQKDPHFHCDPDPDCAASGQQITPIDTQGSTLILTGLGNLRDWMGENIQRGLQGAIETQQTYEEFEQRNTLAQIGASYRLTAALREDIQAEIEGVKPNLIYGDDISKEQAKEFLREGNLYEAMKVMNIDINVQTEEGLIIGTSHLIPVDINDGLAAMLKKGAAEELIKERGLDISNPQDWPEEEIQFIIEALPSRAPNLAKAIAEVGSPFGGPRFFGLPFFPITREESSQVAHKICTDKYGNLCNLRPYDAGAYELLTDDELVKTIELTKEFKGEGFQPAGIELVRKYAASRLSTSVEQDPIQLQAQKERFAEETGVSLEEVDHIAETYNAYNQVGNYYRTQTPEGRLWQGEANRRNIEAVTAAATWAAAPFVIEGGTTIGKAVFGRFFSTGTTAVAEQVTSTALTTVTDGVIRREIRSLTIDDSTVLRNWSEVLGDNADQITRDVEERFNNFRDRTTLNDDQLLQQILEERLTSQGVTTPQRRQALLSGNDPSSIVDTFRRYQTISNNIQETIEEELSAPIEDAVQTLVPQALRNASDATPHLNPELPPQSVAVIINPDEMEFQTATSLGEAVSALTRPQDLIVDVIGEATERFIRIFRREGSEEVLEDIENMTLRKIASDAKQAGDEVQILVKVDNVIYSDDVARSLDEVLDQESKETALQRLVSEDERSILIQGLTQTFDDPTSINWQIGDYIKIYGEAISVAEKRFDGEDLIKAREDLLSIAASGDLRGYQLIDIRRMPGRWGLYGDMRSQRKFVMNLYLQDPQLALDLVKNQIVGGHGSNSGSLLGVLEKGLLPQNQLEEAGSLIATGERLMQIPQANIGEEFVSFARWYKPGVLTRYSSIKSPQLAEDYMENALKQLEEARIAERKEEIDLYGEVGPNSEAGYNFRVQQLNKLLEFIRSPNKSEDDLLRAELIKDNFPVIYLIDQPAEGTAYAAFTGLHDEFIIEGGVKPEIIRSVLVPSERIEEVKQLVQRFGRDWEVSSIEAYQGKAQNTPAPCSISLIPQTYAQEDPCRPAGFLQRVGEFVQDRLNSVFGRKTVSETTVPVESIITPLQSAVYRGRLGGAIVDIGSLGLNEEEIVSHLPSNFFHVSAEDILKGPIIVPKDKNFFVVTGYNKNLSAEDRRKIEASIRSNINQRSNNRLKALVLTDSLPDPARFHDSANWWFNGPFDPESEVWSLRKNGDQLELVKQKDSLVENPNPQTGEKFIHAWTENGVIPCPLTFNLIPTAYAASITVPCPEQSLLQRIRDTFSKWWGDITGRETSNISESVPLDRPYFLKGTFNAQVELRKVDGVLVEVGGPTNQGYQLVDLQALSKKLYVSNKESGCPIYGKEGRIGYLGSVNLRVDATKMPFKNGSVGAVFASCLGPLVDDPVAIPVDTLRKQTIEEAARVIEPGGLLVWQGGILEDIQNAQRKGFEVVEYSSIPSNLGYNVYNVIFQKPIDETSWIDDILSVNVKR